MKIRTIRIQSFRSFEDETLTLDSLTSLLGPNGAGKSTVLAALNVFFQELGSATDVKSLTAEDFHNGDTSKPIEITVTFSDLSDQAKEDLRHYVRQDELRTIAVAKFDEATGRAPVQRFGERMIFKQFSPYFEAERNRVSAGELKEIFTEVTTGLSDFPNIGRITKENMRDSLREYEEERPQLCEPERSTELFYGATKGKERLAPYIQWIYLPAVKEASVEAEEAGNTALGKLLQRTVRQRLNFDDAIEELRQKTKEEYDALLDQEQDALKEISDRLAKRLATFSHADTGLEVVWNQESDRSVAIHDPQAVIKAQEGKWKGSLLRFGHGLQRSFLLAILQELATLESEAEAADGENGQATLVFACEEPELYQHPPQARHLSTVLRQLSTSGNQVLLTTHSPYFVSGETFEEIRLIRKVAGSSQSYVKSTDFEQYAARIAATTGKKPDKPPVARAKLYSALHPEPAEMFFCDRLVLVEGVEDRAYITAALHLEESWEDIRRTGMHIVPVGGKSNIVPLLVIAQNLEIPTFVVFDADGQEENQERRRQHEQNNSVILKALGVSSGPFPEDALVGNDYAVWPTVIENEVKSDLGGNDWIMLVNEARLAFDPGASLSKNPLLIAEAMRLAWEAGRKPSALVELSEKLVEFASA